ncbi:J domain-containing protein [Janthinobacterium sp. UMAB-60]|uniref:J domain-containing protein n=1 Tax=Janthinobacterium sp. UMAB-60 TaxID=1365365 RepID=UPI001C563D2E|nr:J domain-containing protein [Janthinobacterium sp. UMAB-60]
MGKIHTHYDNLKVARLAPQEVIRAAYKALSQKYHPDKNPGDEKAARIMAILNSAYGTLSDPQRRREHDEWIAAEEWEIEWLESTHQEDGKSRDGRAKGHAQSHEHAWAQDVPPSRGKPRRGLQPVWRNWRWWLSLLVCLLLGWLGALLMLDTSPPVPVALASAWSGLARDGAQPHAPAAGAAPPSSKGEAVAVDSWAVGKPYAPEPQEAKTPEIRVLAVSQLSLKAIQPVCDGAGKAESAALVAPNGEPWPTHSGYVDGFLIGNKGEELAVSIDNSHNAAPVFVKLYDTERRSNVRYLYILANDKLLMEQLSAGKYEVRYQAVGPGQDNCGGATRGGASAPAVGEDGAKNPVVSGI